MAKSNGKVPQLYSKPFYFLRHGETAWNKMARFQGSVDVPLNETGLRQAHEVKPFLKEESISHIFSSQLLRAKKTAEVVSEELDVPHFIKNDLQETSFGDLEGKDVTTKQLLCEKLTNAVVEALNVKKEAVSVYMWEIKPENLGRGGVLRSESA